MWDTQKKTRVCFILLKRLSEDELGSPPFPCSPRAVPRLGLRTPRWPVGFLETVLVVGSWGGADGGPR